MKKRILNLLAMAGLLLSLLPGCAEEERIIPEEIPGLKSNELQLNWSLPGIEQVRTYAVEAETHECTINEIYTLFFRTSGHAEPDMYVGYTRTGINSSGSSSGSSRVTLPVGENVNDAWQLVVLANLESYFDPDAANDVHTWLEETLKPGGTGITLSEARLLLTGISKSTNGIPNLLPISGEKTKAVNENVANVILTRRVARIDVIKDPGVQDFVLESASIWNARSSVFLLDFGGNITNDHEFIHYEDRVVTTNTGSISAALYTFPNVVPIPQPNDRQTTCLIVGGRYNNNTQTSYYRINICPSGESQNLKGNGLYTINITGVSADGKENPDDAYNDEDLTMRYTITEWDDTMPATYVYDMKGNGLAVSQRYVTFSENGGQYLNVEVFRVENPVEPIQGNWSIGSVTGTDASQFYVEEMPGGRFFRITTASDNETSADRHAKIEIRWGDLAVPVEVTQLSAVSQLEGIQAVAPELSLNAAGDPREIYISLLGNFYGLTRDDITMEITDNTGAANWLQVIPGTADEPNKGIFYYRFVPLALSSGSREATVRFTVSKGNYIATTSVRVRQNWVNTENVIRNVVISMWEETSPGAYNEIGNLLPKYNAMQGLPDGMKGENHLQFSLAESTTFKYRMDITSSMDWSIVTPGNTGPGLDFSQYSYRYEGNPQPVEVWVTAVDDTDYGWSGLFYIQFADGEMLEFYAHQQGVFKTLGAYEGNSSTDNGLYYYGTIHMNGKLWLDRNIGAKVGMDPENPDVGYFSNSTTGLTNTPDAKGVYFSRAQANSACPAGFRLPHHEAGYGEWDWLFGETDAHGGALVWTGTTGVQVGNKNVRNAWYVTYSDEPVQRFFLPVGGSSALSTSSIAYYWIYGTGYIEIYAESETKRLNTTMDYPREILVRCVRNN